MIIQTVWFFCGMFMLKALFKPSERESESEKDQRIRRKISKKAAIFAFASAFVWCELALIWRIIKVWPAFAWRVWSSAQCGDRISGSRGRRRRQMSDESKGLIEICSNPWRLWKEKIVRFITLKFNLRENCYGIRRLIWLRIKFSVPEES